MHLQNHSLSKHASTSDIASYTDSARDNKSAIGAAVVLGDLIKDRDFRIGAHFPSVRSLLLPQYHLLDTTRLKLSQKRTERDFHPKDKGRSTQKILTR